jgi:2Fe-2S ferredoxin
MESQVVKVTFLPSGRTVEVDLARAPFGDHGEPGSILDVALAHGISLDHACGGVCACSTCHVHVRSGAEHLTPIDESTRENDMLDQARDLTLESRLACQAVLKGTGDVVVEIPGWNRNLARE